jgi:hypothetical protein
VCGFYLQQQESVNKSVQLLASSTKGNVVDCRRRQKAWIHTVEEPR